MKTRLAAAPFAFLCATVICSITGTGTGTAQAATVSGTYYGTITRTSDPAFPYLAVGDTYRIQFSYDSAIPDTDPDPAFGFYENAASGSVMFSNGYHLTFSGGDIYVGNDVDPGDSDYFNFGGGASVTSNFPTGLYTLGGVGVGLVDFSRSVFSSDALPSAYLSAALFEPGEPTGFQIGFPGIGGPGAGLNGTLTSTPLPATLPLFAAALGGLALLGRRKRAQRGGA